MVIKCGISEAELIRRMHHIVKKAEENDGVLFALGACHVTDRKKVREALRMADNRMYEDKKAYYEKHPERKIR